jgi:hypothetical protein
MTFIVDAERKIIVDGTVIEEGPDEANRRRQAILASVFPMAGDPGRQGTVRWLQREDSGPVEGQSSWWIVSSRLADPTVDAEQRPFELLNPVDSLTEETFQLIGWKG